MALIPAAGAGHSRHRANAAVAGGDDLSLNLIMDRWKDRLLSFLYRRTGRYDVALDLSQETFVNLYHARSRYKPSGSFSTYLFSIASNLVRNHIRWTQRHPTVSLDGIGRVPLA
jgi:RNA polymerase sigma-70 factor (ECF subfamily)